MKQLLISLQEFQSRLSRSFLGVRIFNAQIFNVHLLATAQEHESHCYAEQVRWVSRGVQSNVVAVVVRRGLRVPKILFITSLDFFYF
ncbi:MAG TPA: hypothetical protein VEV83_03790 [Parafilimonas sp.]|nr:hypothetical protein [Parafilimonas sp.]